MENKFTMKKKSRLFIFSGCSVFFLILAFPFYHIPPMVGVVHDTTGAPVQNAVVIAMWFSQRPGFHSPNQQLLDIQETTTDNAGQYRIAGWQLKFLPRFFARININQPELIVYKYGFIPKKFFNSRTKKNSDNHGFTIDWNGPATLTISSLEGSTSERIATFESARNLLQIIYSCQWQKVERLLLEADKQLEEQEAYYALTDKYYENKPWFMANEYTENKKNCPNPTNLLLNERKLRHRISNGTH